MKLRFSGTWNSVLCFANQALMEAESMFTFLVNSFGENCMYCRATFSFSR